MRFKRLFALLCSFAIIASLLPSAGAAEHSQDHDYSEDALYSMEFSS